MSFLGLGRVTEVLIGPVELTPEITASLGPVKRFDWPCPVFREHPATEKRGCYVEGRLVSVKEFCTACKIAISSQDVIGEERTDDWPRVLRRLEDR